jgi:hypothetical protein
LISDIERKSNGQLLWHDFDYQYTIELGNPASEPGGSGSILLVFEKEDTNKCLVLRSCTPLDFKLARKQLVELGRCVDSLLATKCVFNYYRGVYVGSEYSDFCLAEIIDSPFELNEKHVALVLRQESAPYLVFWIALTSSRLYLVYWSYKSAVPSQGRV